MLIGILTVLHLPTHSPKSWDLFTSSQPIQVANIQVKLFLVSARVLLQKVFHIIDYRGRLYGTGTFDKCTLFFSKSTNVPYSLF